MGWHHDNGWWVIFPIFWLLVLVAIGFAVAAFARGAWAPRRSRGEDSALEVLRRRFAAGEIDETEFEKRRELLSR